MRSPSLYENQVRDHYPIQKKGANPALNGGTNSLNIHGGAERDRTVDLLTASQALSQLSYSPDNLK